MQFTFLYVFDQSSGPVEELYTGRSAFFQVQKQCCRSGKRVGIKRCRGLFFGRQSRITGAEIFPDIPGAGMCIGIFVLRPPFGPVASAVMRNLVVSYVYGSGTPGRSRTSRDRSSGNRNLRRSRISVIIRNGGCNGVGAVSRWRPGCGIRASLCSRSRNGLIIYLEYYGSDTPVITGIGRKVSGDPVVTVLPLAGVVK